MNWWQYLLLVNIYLTLFFGFYELLLRRETFFQLNRLYLTGTALLSFGIPAIQSNWVKGLFITQKIKYTLYAGQVNITSFVPVKQSAVTIGQLLTVLYITGALFLAARLIVHLLALKKVISTPAPFEAYSFFKKIHLGKGVAARQEIIDHEKVHARQWHSADVLLMEAVIIISWFNPVVYLYRYAVKRIHEFIADQQAVKAGADKADYALLLLSQTFHTQGSHLVNPFFNYSLLKQRIMMLQKSRSQRIKLVRYSLLAPLFILMMVLSSATINNSRAVIAVNNNAKQLFLKPAYGVIANDDPLATSYVPAAKTLAYAQDEPLKTIDADQHVQPLDTLPIGKDMVFTQVDQSPDFPGGDKEFVKYLANNIKYPKAARDNKIQGRIILTFIIETDGSLSNIKLVRGIGGGADEEAIRVMKASPNWAPGIQNGKPVRVQFSVPISFSLAGEKTDNRTGSLKLLPDVQTAGQATPDSLKNPLTKPLYVIDGKEVLNTALSTIDTKDIESTSVLKDKNAVALYGAKGANGVIIVTTKKQKVKELAENN